MCKLCMIIDQFRLSNQKRILLKSNFLLQRMVFFISLNRISIIKEKSHRISHFRIIILSTYSHFSTALELIFSRFSVICSHQTSGFKCLFQAQSLLHFRLGCLGSRGLGPGGQLPRPRGLAQRLPRGKRSVRKPPV